MIDRNTYLEETITAFIEGRLGKKEAMKNKAKEEGFGGIFAQASQLLMERTKRGAKSTIPGNLPFTTDDIIHLLKAVKDDPSFMEGIKTAKQLADRVIDLCFDILSIANGFVEDHRLRDNYKGKLAYEITEQDRNKLGEAIKLALNAVFLLDKKRFKPAEGDAQNLVMRKVLNYIMKKNSLIEGDLQSLAKDSTSSNAKLKAEAVANIKNLNKRLGVSDSIKAIRDAFEVVKKYSGSDSLIWPTLAIKIKNGDEYSSLFKYIDAYKAGKDIGHAKKWVSQFKNKTKAEIKKKILTEQNFRKNLKAAVKAFEVNKKPGGQQTIKELQSIASILMKGNPEYVKDLKSQGIKETAIDEIVSMLAGFIRVGALAVKME